jgi:ribonucleoside-diphosphate reductase subunit M1
MAKMTSMHFYAWEKGLKTGMYYLRSRPAADPIKFTVDVEALLKDGGKIDITNNLKRKASELKDVLDLEETDKKLKTSQPIQGNGKKLKTIPIE